MEFSHPWLSQLKLLVAAASYRANTVVLYVHTDLEEMESASELYHKQGRRMW